MKNSANNKLVLVILTLILWFPTLLKGQDEIQKFTIEGVFSNPTYNGTKVYLRYYREKHIIDSTTVLNGKYLFSGITEPTLASIWVKDVGYKIKLIKLFFDGGKIGVKSKITFDDAIVTGSVMNDEYYSLLKVLAPFEKARDQLQDTAWSKKASKIAMLNKSIDSIYLSFAVDNPLSKVAFYALQMAYKEAIDVEVASKIFKNFPIAIRQSKSGKVYATQLEGLKRTGIGRAAPLFEQTDTAGKLVKLSDFRGKYVFIDFWASWCGPCRLENPNVAKAFNEFKDKGFTVIGVSLDRPEGRQAWLNAIRKDGLNWTNVSDLNFWDNSVAKLYGITSIPQNFLVDPSGKIVAKNLKGDKLLQELRERIALKQPK